MKENVNMNFHYNRKKLRDLKIYCCKSRAFMYGVYIKKMI